MHPTTERQPDSVLAWHFVGATLRDGRPVPADGELLRHDGPMVLCKSGLHASIRALDALVYAPGNTVCRVRMAGDIQHESDKLVARERTILWRLNATDVLRAFARQCAADRAAWGVASASAWDAVRAAKTARLEAAIYAAAGRTPEDDR